MTKPAPRLGLSGRDRSAPECVAEDEVRLHLRVPFEVGKTSAPRPARPMRASEPRPHLLPARSDPLPPAPERRSRLGLGSGIAAEPHDRLRPQLAQDECSTQMNIAQIL